MSEGNQAHTHFISYLSTSDVISSDAYVPNKKNSATEEKKEKMWPKTIT